MIFSKYFVNLVVSLTLLDNAAALTTGSTRGFSKTLFFLSRYLKLHRFKFEKPLPKYSKY